jgi:hypothetical protein
MKKTVASFRRAIARAGASGALVRLERALALRKLQRPADPKIALADVASLLTSASSTFPLVTIHREIVDPEVCHIGRVVKVSNTTVTLREITPNATWERRLHRYALQDIARVDVGRSYEEALHAVVASSGEGLQ